MNISQHSTTTKLNAVIDRAIEEKRIVGTVVLIYKHGELIFQRAAGLADREAHHAMSDNSIFRLSSVTKPIVTAAAMRLIEDKILDLDAPITKWLPDFKPQLADGSVPEIRIRDLLAHMSGLSYRFIETADSAYGHLQVSDGLDQPTLCFEENLKRIASTTLIAKPGQEWHYSLSLDVLGAVMQSACEKPLEEIVKTLVTNPLGMNDTAFHVSDKTRLVQPYINASPEPQLMSTATSVPLWGSAIHYDPSRILTADAYPSGGCGMAGTASDIMRLLEVIRTGGSPILKPETVEAMRVVRTPEGSATQGPGWGFGFGWAILEDPSLTQTPQSKGTAQWGGVYGHNWFIDFEQGISLVALTNTLFEGMSGAFPQELRDAIYTN